MQLAIILERKKDQVSQSGWISEKSILNGDIDGDVLFILSGQRGPGIW